MVDWNLSGIGNIIISLLALMIIFDTWFYWVHRALHLKPLYIRFHKQHHESMTPTPWATYSFSSFEVIVNCPLWVLFFTFPAHPLAMIIGLFAQNIYNTFGHLGYEFFPKWMLRNKYICTVQATPTHHDAHHRYLQGNFRHYYNIWDILMKTELKQYKPLRESVYEQLSNSPTAKPGGQPQSTGPT